uniref:Uncharacterized protein n=1 Tax=Rhizophora mucronata TaxID=61149 RepID=A0A2P2MH18_RHIMU
MHQRIKLSQFHKKPSAFYHHTGLSS